VKSALEWAANLLARARFPVFGGLLTDIRGAEAALELAAKLGVVVDHAASTGLMPAATTWNPASISRSNGASTSSMIAIMAPTRPGSAFPML
jgi:formylmethanofuran dehydrogenase subunit B